MLSQICARREVNLYCALVYFFFIFSLSIRIPRKIRYSERAKETECKREVLSCFSEFLTYMLLVYSTYKRMDIQAHWRYFTRDHKKSESNEMSVRSEAIGMQTAETWVLQEDKWRRDSRAHLFKKRRKRRYFAFGIRSRGLARSIFLSLRRSSWISLSRAILSLYI